MKLPPATCWSRITPRTSMSGWVSWNMERIDRNDDRGFRCSRPGGRIRTTRHRPFPRHNERQDRVKSADERDSGGDGTGSLQVLVRRFRPGPCEDGGRDTGLLEDIADLFPDQLVDSQMGEKREGWCATTSQDAIQRLAHLTDGGAYQAVETWGVLDTAVALPDEQVRLTFSSLVATFLNRQKVNQREAPILTVLRDTHQPELILGEIRVPVVEGALESVT